MAPLHVLLPFFVTMLIFAAMPGPAILYTTAQTVARGRKAGLMTALGIHVGGYAYVIASALGLAAILTYVPTLYMAIKLTGAAYLIWLGISLMHKPAGAGQVVKLDRRSAKRAFVESVSVELLNPKTAIFYIAFLPQFVSPHAAFPAAVQFLILGVMVNLMFSCADIVTVLLAAHLAARLGANGRRQRLARIAGGSILIGLGMKLVISQT